MTLPGAAATEDCTGQEQRQLIPRGSPSSIPDGEAAWANDGNETVAALKRGTILVNGGHQPPATRPGGPTPPSTWFQKRAEGGVPPLVYKVELNVVWWVMVILGTVVRLWRLDYPRCVV